MMLHICDYIADRDNVRVKLSRDFCNLVYNKLRLKFSSIANYNKIKDLAKTHDSLYDWLRNYKAIRLKHIIEITKDLNIQHEDLHKNIIGFTSQGSKFILKMPFFIEIIQELTEFYGMYLGDGETSEKSQSLSFGNTSETMIKKFLTFIVERLNIDLSDFSISIQVPYYPYDESLIKLKWAQKLGIKNTNIKQVYHTPKIKINGIESTRNKEYCRIKLNRSIIRWLFDDVSNLLKPYILNDKELAIGYLRGIFAAEGCCSFYSKYKRVVTIDMKDKNEIKFISTLLYSLDIPNKVKQKTNREMWFIDIYNRKSFEKLFYHNLFKLHENKQKIFYDMLNSYKFNSFQPKEFEVIV